MKWPMAIWASLFFSIADLTWNVVDGNQEFVQFGAAGVVNFENRKGPVYSTHLHASSNAEIQGQEEEKVFAPTSNIQENHSKERLPRSASVEHYPRLSMLQSLPDTGHSLVDYHPPESYADLEGRHVEWKWCLLSIAGNATVVRLRKDDFVRYLRMNVASLTGSEYDLVRVNSVSYTPHVMVNVSLDWSEARHHKIVKTLDNLATHNDTILDLSGLHYNLTDFVPASALLAPKPVAPLEDGDAAAAAADPRQMEALIYMAVGATIAFLMTATLLFAVCHCLGRPKNQQETLTSETRDDELRSQHSHRHSFLQASPMTEESISLNDYDHRFEDEEDRYHHHHQRHQQHRRSAPKLIYTQEFSDGLMVLPDNDVRDDCGHGQEEHWDDSLAPLASFDDEHSCVPHRYVLRRGLQHYRSPVANVRSESECDPLVFRQNGLLPARPNSVLEEPMCEPLSPPPDFTTGYSSDVPGYGRTRPNSNRRNNLSRRPQTPLVLSSFKPYSPTSNGIPSISQPTPEEIERDVDVIFRNMGLDNPSYR